MFAHDGVAWDLAGYLAGKRQLLRVMMCLASVQLISTVEARMPRPGPGGRADLPSSAIEPGADKIDLGLPSFFGHKLRTAGGGDGVIREAPLDGGHERLR